MVMEFMSLLQREEMFFMDNCNFPPKHIDIGTLMNFCGICAFVGFLEGSLYIHIGIPSIICIWMS